LLDGSVLRATSLSASARGVTIAEPLLGQIFIPAGELFEIRRNVPSPPAAATNPSAPR
jgi:hypothetical protein